MLLIKNGRLVDAYTDVVADILVEDGKIKWIGNDFSCENSIDANGKIVMPAFVDTHAHFRDPGFTYKEDLLTGSQAALKGGYGTVNLMANTKPVVDTPSVYEDIVTRSKEIGLINIFQCFAVTKGLLGNEFIDFNTLPGSVKFLSDDGKGIFRNKMSYDLLKILKEKDIGVMIHEEDKELSPIDYRIAEDVHTIRDVYLAGKTGAKVHFSHVSTIDSIKAVEAGKDNGYNITMEVTPHHLYMYDSDYRVNPPIRTKADVEYLIESIKNGYVDCIATDHAPHSFEDKEKGAPGMIGLETAFYICYKVLIEENKCDLKLLSKVMSLGGAKILGLNKGRLLPGYDGDIVIIDLNKKTKVENFKSKSQNSPFIGEEFTGSIEYTIVDGEVRYRKQ